MMNEGIKPVQIMGFAAALLLTFAAGFHFMSQPPEPASTIAEKPEFVKVEPEKLPEPETPKQPIQEFDPKKITIDDIPEFKEPEPPRQLTIAPDAAPFAGPWRQRSIWGLPNPAPLDQNVKRALNTLGAVSDTNGYSFNSVRLDDGSIVPGKPAPTKQELKVILIDNINKNGLGDGFEAAVLALAPRAMDYMILEVGKRRPWKEVLPILGGDPQRTGSDDVYLGKTATEYHRVTWQYYGWLAFGVSNKTNQVVAVKASMRNVPLIAPESIPNGRTPPDPEYIKKKAEERSRERNGPPEVFKLLGTAVKVQVTTRTTKPDAEQPGRVKAAQDLVGKPLYPEIVRTAAMLKQSWGIQHLIVTPSGTITTAKMTELLGETKFTSKDTTTLPGTTLTWYRYGFWLELGVAGNNVRRVRISVRSILPSGY